MVYLPNLASLYCVCGCFTLQLQARATSRHKTPTSTKNVAVNLAIVKCYFLCLYKIELIKQKLYVDTNAFEIVDK